MINLFFLFNDFLFNFFFFFCLNNILILFMTLCNRFVRFQAKLVTVFIKTRMIITSYNVDLIHFNFNNFIVAYTRTLFHCGFLTIVSSPLFNLVKISFIASAFTLVWIRDSNPGIEPVPYPLKLEQLTFIMFQTSTYTV